MLFCYLPKFQNPTFKINLSGIPWKCQTVWIQIRPDILSGLICVQTVFKCYQQTTLVRTVNIQVMPNSLNFTGIYFLLTLLLASASKKFDILIVFLEEYFEKVNFEKNQQATNKHEKLPSTELMLL